MPGGEISPWPPLSIQLQSVQISKRPSLTIQLQSVQISKRPSLSMSTLRHERESPTYQSSITGKQHFYRPEMKSHGMERESPREVR